MLQQLTANFWNPVTCFMVCVLIYVAGEQLSRLSKGNISSLMFASFFFLIGFWTILPDDVTTKTGLPALASNFVVALLITNLGAKISLEELLAEWKTVAIAVLGLGGIALVAFTVGTWMFGQEYALTAAPPISGGTIAGVMVQAAAAEAGRPELGAFAVLVLSFQKFFGMPIATLGMKKEASRKLAAGDFDRDISVSSGLKLPSMRIFGETPAYFKSDNSYLFKLAFVATLANLVGLSTRIPGDGPANYWLNPNIAYLLFGLIFARIGFLEKDSLAKSHSGGLGNLALMIMLPGSLAKVTPSGLLEMIFPLFGMLAMSTVGIVFIAVIVGKVVGYSPYISAAIACTCMIGYPGTEILTNEVVNSYTDITPEQRERMSNYLMPKIIVGGFATVTVASVIFAGIICPMIFA